MESRVLTTGHSLWQRLRASRAWRIPATGFGFVMFGIGGAVLSMSAFPVIYFLPINRRRKEALTRKLIALVFRNYLRLLWLLGLISYELRNVSELHKPNQLIIVNHPSLLDVVFIIALTGDTSCIVKGSLLRNPFTTLAVRTANYISNSDINLFQRCVSTLKEGNSLIAFPEGTRSRPGEPLKFRRGPSNIALSANIAITPVIISCVPAALLKHQKWYEVSVSPPHYTIQVMPRYDVGGYRADGQLQSTAARQLTRDLAEYFARNINTA